MAANLLSFDFIRGRLSSEQLEDLAVSLGVCLECGGNLVSKDGEIVCSSCGLVWAVENTADYVPFPDYESADGGEGSRFEGHWQPGNTLAFLKGLGDPALANGKGRALMRVLAKSPNGATDLGLRARQIKTLIKMGGSATAKKGPITDKPFVDADGAEGKLAPIKLHGKPSSKNCSLQTSNKTADKLQAWRRHNSPHHRKVWIENRRFKLES